MPVVPSRARVVSASVATIDARFRALRSAQMYKAGKNERASFEGLKRMHERSSRGSRASRDSAESARASSDENARASSDENPRGSRDEDPRASRGSRDQDPRASRGSRDSADGDAGPSTEELVQAALKDGRS